MDFRVNFSGRAHSFSDSEIDAVIQAMKRADPLTQGRYRNEFEKKFSEYVGGHRCFTVCNATSALEMAAQLCCFKDGDEVIIPSHTFTSSAYPFVKKGAKPVWADIDLETKVVTPETIRPLISARTKALVVVHLYGFMADMPAIMELAREHSLIVIEDAAQVIGCSMNGQMAGTFGEIGVFSFHSHKNMTTLGEGGMILLKKQEWIDILPRLRHNGHCAFSFEQEEYWLPAMGNVDLPELDGHAIMPNNYCLGEIECALGIELLKRVDSINQEKRERALRFIDSLSSYPELAFHRVDSERHNYHLLVARLTNGKRNEFMRRMSRDWGVKCVIQYCPLHRYDFYKKIGFGEADCPNTDSFYDNMVSFPFQHSLTDKDLNYMLEATRAVLDEIRNE